MTHPAPPPAAASVRPTTPSATVRQARFDDYEQIAAVEAGNGLTAKERSQWTRLWLDNPAYQELPGWPLGWVLENSAGRIVGSIGNIPFLYRLQGCTYVAAAGRGWAVDPPYRQLALMLLERHLEQPGVDLHVATTPSRVVSALYGRLGWSRPPVGRWDRSAVWVTNYTDGVRRLLLSRVSRPITGVVGSMAYPVLWLANHASRLGRGQRKSPRLEWIANFDGRFDTFWRALESRKAHLLLSDRSRPALGWHFHQALAANRLWILAASDGAELAGYTVFERRDARSSGLYRMLLVDCQTLPGYPSLAATMVDHALKRCRLEGIHVLENIGCWLGSRPVGPAGPYRRALTHCCYLYRARNPELAEALLNPVHWCPTQYDGDSAL